MFELTNQAAVPQSISLFRFLDTLVFALIGLICVLAAPRFGWLLLGGLTVASAVICIKVAASLHMIWNPLLPVLGMFITAGLTVGLSRVTRPTRVGND